MIDKLAPSLCFIDPKFIPTETDRCQCNCGGFLKTQKTQKRSVVLLDFGEVLFKETVKYCPSCNGVFGSERLSKLVADYANFSFEIIEFVGRKLFIEHCTEDKVLKALMERNVNISPREISVLGRKFILYLAQAHKDKESEVKGLIQKKGGYIGHLDGTCDGASPHFFCAVEEELKLVLLSRKIPSESIDAITPILRDLDAAYGKPLGIVCDMSKAIIGAVEEVFPGLPIFICHFHFLRDLGKDLFKMEYDLLGASFRDFNVKIMLSRFARELRSLIHTYPQLSKHLNCHADTLFAQELPEEVFIFW